MYRPDSDTATSTVDNCNGVSAATATALDERKTKIKLPTPPVQPAAQPSRSPEHKAIASHGNATCDASPAHRADDPPTAKLADVAHALGKRIEPIAEHKTTLGEAEIQNAVEAAAVIFKKVVLQRRAAKTATAHEDGKFCCVHSLLGRIKCSFCVCGGGKCSSSRLLT